jgi:predicted Zn finger-like uncharacterized protein
MALITRCPVCGTLFKVVPDQLRISEGWVRCGHCAEIFDASGDLQQSDAEHQLVPPLAPVAGLPPELSALVSEPAWVPAPFVLAPIEWLPELSVPVQDASEPVLPMVAESEVVVLPAAEPGLMEPSKVLNASVVEGAPDNLATAEPEPFLAVDAGGYSFALQPSPEIAVLRPSLRRLWVAAAVLLAAVLGLQGIFHGRDRIAAAWPETKPWLHFVCAQIGCTVQALRQIEAIVIDSSTLSALQNEDAYRLSLVLKNQAVLDLAMPAIEFVLTDIDEQAVFRRVLTPAELGAASRLLFAGREWTASVDVQVTDNPNKGRIVGYRLVAFYP